MKIIADEILTGEGCDDVEAEVSDDKKLHTCPQQCRDKNRKLNSEKKGVKLAEAP